MQIPLSTKAKAIRKKDVRNNLAFLSLVGPLVLGLILFVYLPIIWGLSLSFYQARYSVTPTTFVGLQNYVDLLQDQDFLNSLGTFTIFAAFIVPITLIGALLLALLVNTIHVARGFFRTVFFIPSACSVVVAAMIWRDSLFLGTTQGFANIVLDRFHIAPIVWIGSMGIPWHWVVLISCRLWLGLGYNMILFLAGLQQIPPSLYEAAYVDGAKPGWSTFWNITFPLLRNTTAIVISLNLIAAFQAFDEFYNILGGTYGGANLNLAKSPLIYLFKVAFSDQDYGKGAAGAFILAAIIVIFTVVQTRFYGFGDTEVK
ncbi:sugar ABC transporter permease [Dictyobacter alpinus]|uniref:Sugar ABC transporter permease n=1 Tax=Dictyobacter alpinus TaxID=2014873 RepID=A0A402BE98_9CHLR|nr:sugar ABC transporter permease [Dictyobacter alpinus]GCE29577.1 sugar ABC transporter permease [Dictyobacter alpinus]